MKDTKKEPQTACLTVPCDLHRGLHEAYRGAEGWRCCQTSVALEEKTETTTVHWGHIGIMEKKKQSTIVVPVYYETFLSEADVEKTLKLQGDSLFQANADLNRLGCDPPPLL